MLTSYTSPTELVEIVLSETNQIDSNATILHERLRQKLTRRVSGYIACINETTLFILDYISQNLVNTMTITETRTILFLDMQHIATGGKNIRIIRFTPPISTLVTPTETPTPASESPSSISKDSPEKNTEKEAKTETSSPREANVVVLKNEQDRQYINHLALLQPNSLVSASIGALTLWNLETNRIEYYTTVTNINQLVRISDTKFATCTKQSRITVWSDQMRVLNTVKLIHNVRIANIGNNQILFNYLHGIGCWDSETGVYDTVNIGKHYDRTILKVNEKKLVTTGVGKIVVRSMDKQELYSIDHVCTCERVIKMARFDEKLLYVNEIHQMILFDVERGGVDRRYTGPYGYISQIDAIKNDPMRDL